MGSAFGSMVWIGAPAGLRGGSRTVIRGCFAERRDPSLLQNRREAAAVPLNPYGGNEASRAGVLPSLHNGGRDGPQAQSRSEQADAAAPGKPEQVERWSQAA